MKNARFFLFAPLLAGAATVSIAAPPVNSPYFTDRQSSHVQDATSESIGQVNMITCVMSAMRPDALVNQGPYAALIDKNKCDAAKQASTANSGASSDAAQAPDYMNAVVNSTRASNNDPMVVSAWLSLNQDGTPVTVFAHISATEAPSDGNPYGAFRLDYCGKTAGGGSCLMNGFMQAGSGTLSYYETETGGGGNDSRQTALQLSSVGTSTGGGSVNVTSSRNGQTQTQAFDFAYDQSYFLRHDDDSSYACFSRDATDPGTGLSVWQYGLYDSTTGAPVNLNSGFPIQYTNAGKTYQGYVGYYGMSGQPGAPLPANGSTVQKVDYQNGGATTASYTVANNGGRLVRYTRQTTTLAQIDQIQLNVFVNDPTGSALPDPNTNYVMNWDEATQQFIATGEMQCGQGGCQAGGLSNGQGAVSVSPAFWSTMGLQGWSQSLGGGSMFIALNSPGNPVGATTVVYYSQDLVYPDDASVPATLYCVSNCPTASSLQGFFTQGQVPSPFAGSTANAWQPTTTPVTYIVSGNLLTGGDDSANAAVFTDASVYPQFPQFQNGVMSGHLVANLADAQCGTDPQTQSPQYCDWSASSAPVYYQWQTGPNSWNQFTALADANLNFVHFDAPMNVHFTVPANVAGNAPYGNYAGTTMVLQYGGFGNLWGIPGNCVSSATNLPMACNDPSGTARYVPAFAIPYDPSASPQQGVVTTSASGVTTTYLVKWLNREIRFAKKPNAACTTAGLTTSGATLPDATGLQDPSDSASAVYNGTEPTVTDAPRVVQGEVKF